MTRRFFVLIERASGPPGTALRMTWDGVANVTQVLPGRSLTRSPLPAPARPAPRPSHLTDL